MIAGGDNVIAGTNVSPLARDFADGLRLRGRIGVLLIPGAGAAPNISQKRG